MQEEATIREEVLNETVWNAVKKAILNPNLIVEQVKKLRAAGQSRTQTRNAEAAQIAREKKQIETEESRVLEAYRRGVISPTRLGGELEKLKVRRNAIASREAEYQEQGGPDLPPRQVERSVRVK